MDFDTGRYFSSENVGPYVWRLLSEGISFELITAGVAQRYGKKPDQVRAHVRRFLEELLSENLLVLDPELPCAPPTNAAQPAADPGPLSFEAPILSRFTDMETMLLLDCEPSDTPGPLGDILLIVHVRAGRLSRHGHGRCFPPAARGPENASRGARRVRVDSAIPQCGRAGLQ